MARGGDDGGEWWMPEVDGVGKRTEVEKGTAERKRKGCVEFWARGVEGRGDGSRKKGREGGRRAWRGWNRNRNRKQGAQEDD